ncbi:hypothetical protein EK21DRAFT_106822 [Setomelanomma holmii]|uniref:F-box domain-containing protein n=1 Tax=Setomelanomma holmii TaxID=210430 RepID=A0A9P4LS38_9PLEO|nr:hypothetical protein EK21DRAFT_106822 [Setomelanomma holmii]
MDQLDAPSPSQAEAQSSMPPDLNFAACKGDTAATASPEIYAPPNNPQACLDRLPEELLMTVLDGLPLSALSIMCRTNARYKRLALFLPLRETRLSRSRQN